MTKDEADKQKNPMSLPSEKIIETLNRIMKESPERDSMLLPTKEVEERLIQLEFYNFKSRF
ncbi:hypothetical protein [Massilia genomosp. 1]|uniref:Uncharacterized protein n=1 Tax=Massilia genomosp. 1 TaxID=2609280 RepID=A0ABX0MV89_9BURK|nr:hypothetical protein [Massilia genomosp. 1]NHZ66623.1 hypothetical protein [Massilia genomosp. 1]